MNSSQLQKDRAQYIVCAVMVALGGFLIYDAVGLSAGFAQVDPLGPKFFPVVIGVALVVMAAVFAVAIARGSRGHAETGEDIDSHSVGDWPTVMVLIGLLVATVIVMQFLGWVITSGLLFFGAATVLGSKKYLLTIGISVVLSVGTFYAFYSGLGIRLPAGVLNGIL